MAYVSVGHAPLGGPRRAVGSDEPDEEGSSSADDGPAESTPPPPSLLARLELTRRHLIAAAILVACGVVLALMAILRTQATEVELLEPVPIEQTTVSSPPPTPEPVPTMRVHVLGGVTEPGVVTVDEGAIVADAIAAAGGFTSDARPGNSTWLRLLPTACRYWWGSRARRAQSPTQALRQARRMEAAST